MTTLEPRTVNVTSYRHTITTSPAYLAPEAHQPSVTGAEFRQALSQLAAGASIVTTRDLEGNMLGLTATAVTSVSLDPPLVLVCIDNRSRTTAALRADAPFIIHFLTTDQEEIARQFASRVPDKFAGVDYRLTASGCPQLEGALASIECVPHHIYPGGDHTIFVGRVVDVQLGRDDSQPLMYFRNHFLAH